MSASSAELWRVNQKDLKGIIPLVARINELESELRTLTDDDLRWRTVEFRQRLDQGESLDDLLPEAFASVREAAQRTLRLRPFDEQLAGGVFLHEGKFAEIATGEGKTLTATLAAYLNALAGRGVHIVVANEYLAQRDRDWMAPLFEGLGMSVSVLLSSDLPASRARRIAYASDITYGDAQEFGFDYLRDHMAKDLSLTVQRELHYAILDDVDYVLIDAARTPLNITVQDNAPVDLYVRFARLMFRLREGDDYTIDHKEQAASITDVGIDRVEQLLGVRDIYDDVDLTRHLENALKAHAIIQRDRDYIVRDGEVVIVDKVSGRALPGRRYTEGLHQALEAKESVPIHAETHTMATITYQNYFSLYHKLVGMSGVLRTDADEYRATYKRDVVVVPPHVPVQRIDQPDLIYTTKQGKLRAVVEEVRDRQADGQPVLIGCRSIEASEEVSALLDAAGIHHSLLNAKYHEREAQLIAQAGGTGAVTVVSNMAGHGTDIMLGGHPQGLVNDILRERGVSLELTPEEDLVAARAEAERRCAEDHERVVAAGGLYVIGTEHHDSRRMDRQLRGRSGRQGDPGESRFFVSLQDNLLRRMNADRVAGFLNRVGLDDDTPIESHMVWAMIEQAQIKVDAYTFDQRRLVKAYDDEITVHSNLVYHDRQVILERINVHARILDVIEHEARRRVAEATTASSPQHWDLDGLSKRIEPWGVDIPPEVIPEQRKQLRRDTLSNAVARAVREKYEEKERQVIAAAEEHKAVEPGAFYMRQFERAVLLQVIDSLWRDHIDRLDVMRTGIGLRELAQRDPLVEYKREAYAAFDRFKGEVEHNVAELALRAPVQITLNSPPQPLPQPQSHVSTADASQRLPANGGDDAEKPAPVSVGAPQGMMTWMEALVAAANEANATTMATNAPQAKLAWIEPLIVALMEVDTREMDMVEREAMRNGELGVRETT